jgi:cytochrome c peroxidase
MKGRLTFRIGLLVAGVALAAGVHVALVTAQTGSAPRVANLTIQDGDPATIELGRLLFWDPVLSGHKDVACATCHHPDHAYADGRALSLGARSVGLGPQRVSHSGGEIPVVRRNSPTILNTAFNGLRERGGGRRGNRSAAALDPARAPMFWDSRLRSLELQALEPIKSLEEMRGTAYAEDVAVETVLARVRAIPEYVTLFGAAFGSGTPIDGPRLGEAIAAFERSLVALDSPFDRYRAGDSNAMTAQQLRGMDTFDRVGCDRCHDGPMFSDFSLRAEGVKEHPELAAPDAGDGRFRFRTPTLRNIALTAPYMHNGMLATLDDVLRFYDNGRSENPSVADRRDEGEPGPRLDRRFRAVDDMNERERADIVAFLEALTDRDFDRTIPRRVPSGLPPGGHLQASSTASLAR